MEILFPPAQGFAGMFFLGDYKDESAVTRRSATVVLKRGYAIDPAAGRLIPTAEALPILMQDQPDNLVVNADFEMSRTDFGEEPPDTLKAGRWSESANISSLVAAQGVNNSQALRVVGPVGERVTQTLVFENALGGRSFAFSFSAKTDAMPAIVQAVQIEADGSAPLCTLNAVLSNVSLNRFTAVGTWPNGLQATAMNVVLPPPDDPARTVFYDRIQVEERTFATRWDADNVLRYEHDLGAFKPEGDLIVLGGTNFSGNARVRVDGSIWFERLVPADREKALFGWASRNGGARGLEMGVFSSDPNDYPPTDPLPPTFQNKFYNGYDRSSAQMSPFPYLQAGAQILIERNGLPNYQFNLGGEIVDAVFYYYSGTGPDEDNFWQNDAVAMNLDTLVVEPDFNRCYAVWRGKWPFGNYPENAYRRLVVNFSE